jgi:UPF0176 protein
MTALPLLYSFRRCPYAIRARMAIRVSGVLVEIQEVALRDKPPGLLVASPKGTVPVLLLHNGGVMQVIDQSLSIMQWALQQADPEGWLPVADPVSDWVTRNDEVFKPLLDRYKYANRHPELSPSAHRQAALDGFVTELDAQLQARPFLQGDRPRLADVAVFPFVRQFAGVDPAWFAQAALPGVQRWLAHWLVSPVFTAVMAR